MNEHYWPLSDYWLNSALWALGGAMVSQLLGTLLPTRKEARMRLTNYARPLDLVIGLVVICLGVGLLIQGAHSRAADERQRDCLLSYIAANSETSKVRSGLVADESDATRRVIVGTLTAHTRLEVIAAREQYRRALARIDKARDENPLVQFDEASCE